MEPNVPLALRRLRHAEYFAFMSRGSFATIDDSSITNSNSLHVLASPTHFRHQISTSASSAPCCSPESFKSFFPYENSCCRMELLISTSSPKQTNHQSESSPHRLLLLYKSEPVAPTRHPRFAPLSADVRTIGDSIDNIVVRVLAELEESIPENYVSVSAGTTLFSGENEGEENNNNNNDRNSNINDAENNQKNSLTTRNQRPAPLEFTSHSLSGGSELEPLSSTLMKEFKIRFSHLEYVADNLNDACETLRHRFSRDQNQKDASSTTMECLIVCTDGVFIPSGEDCDGAETESTTTTATTAPSSIELLKRLGNEKKRSNGSGQGERNDSRQVAADAWDVVATNHEPDRCDASAVRSMINSTLTVHFAEVILQRRCHVEKQRLIENMKLQLGGSADESNHSNNNRNKDNNVKKELTQGYRQLELEDVRRQIETVKTQLQQQTTLSELLDEQLRGRKLALEGRRREVDEKSKKIKQLRETAEENLDSATKLERQLRLCRNRVLSGMSKLFPITVNAPHSICGFNIPHNEPQNEVHACALGCIVHAVVTFCAVHGHVPLHPLLSQTSRSCVAEYVGAPTSKIFPLYSTNAAEKEQSTRAVMLLRRVMAHAAFAIHNQRQATDLPFGIALQKLLFNR